MLLLAAKKHNINLFESYMIGDSTADIVAGKAAGCKTIGVKTGMALNDGKHCAEPDLIFNDITDAVRFILSEAK
jgi:D-glycero-D-manno-heptose 1,7-bisphosphate phosphatase